MRWWIGIVSLFVLSAALTGSVRAADEEAVAEQQWQDAKALRDRPLDQTTCAIWRDWRGTYQRTRLLNLVRAHPKTLAAAKALLTLGRLQGRWDDDPQSLADTTQAESEKTIRDAMLVAPDAPGLFEAVKLLWGDLSHGEELSDNEISLMKFLVSIADSSGPDSAAAAATLATTLADGVLKERMVKLLAERYPHSSPARQAERHCLDRAGSEIDFTDEEPSLRKFIAAYPGTPEALAELQRIAEIWGSSNCLAFPVKGRPEPYECLLHSMRTRLELARLAGAESSRYIDGTLYFVIQKPVADVSELRDLFLEYYCAHPLNLPQDVLTLGAIAGHKFYAPLADVKFYAEFYRDAETRASPATKPAVILARAYFFDCLAREIRAEGVRVKDASDVDPAKYEPGAAAADLEVDQAAAKLTQSFSDSPEAFAAEDLLAIKALRLENIDDALKHWRILVTRDPAKSLSVMAALHAAKIVVTAEQRAVARELLQTIKPAGDDATIAAYAVPAALGALAEADFDLAMAHARFAEALAHWPELSPVPLFPRYFSANGFNNGQFMWARTLPEPSWVRSDIRARLDRLAPFKSTGFKDLALWRRMLAANGVGGERQELLLQLQRDFPTSIFSSQAIIEQGKLCEAAKDYRKARVQYFKACKLKSSVVALSGAVRLAYLDFEGLGFRDGEPRPNADELVEQLKLAMKSFAESQSVQARTERQALIDGMFQCFWNARLKRFEKDLEDKWLLITGIEWVEFGKEQLEESLPPRSGLNHVVFVTGAELMGFMDDLKALRTNEKFRTDVLERVWLKSWMFDLTLPESWPQHNQFTRVGRLSETLDWGSINDGLGYHWSFEHSESGWKTGPSVMVGGGKEQP